MFHVTTNLFGQLGFCQGRQMLLVLFAPGQLNFMVFPQACHMDKLLYIKQNARMTFKIPHVILFKDLLV